MTQEQILKLEHLKVAEIKPGMFLHIHAEDEYRITSWKEDDDIKHYSGSICIYMPIKDNYDDDFRVITLAEHTELAKRQKEIVMAEMEEKRIKPNID